MPKITLPDVAMFSEEDRAHAVKNEDGSFTIDVRPTQVVSQFRDNNLQLQQIKESALQTLQVLGAEFGQEVKDFKDLDIEAIRTMTADLKTIKQQVDDGKLVADSSLEEAIGRRTAEMRTETDRRITEMTGKMREKDTQIGGLQKEMNDYILTNELTMAVMQPESGVRPEALPDILNRGRSVFKVDGNKKLTAVDGEGRTLFGPDAVNPLSVGEWIKQTLERAPHFSKESQGGGANNNPGGGDGSAANLADTADTGAYVQQRMAEYAKTGR